MKAHVIPRTFYNLDYSQRVPLEIITNSDDGYNGKSFVGIYDSGIVTAEGERVFNPWDTYAYEMLIRRRKALTTRTSDGVVIALEAPKYDYAKLKLFFMSVLWRASVSTQPFFRRVSIGRYEAILREALLQSNPGDKDFFSVVLACFLDMPTKTAMMDPFKEWYEQVVYYRFYLGAYIAYIKVDRQRTPSAFKDFAFELGRPLTIVGREFDRSKEKVVMRKLVEEHAS